MKKIILVIQTIIVINFLPSCSSMSERAKIIGSITKIEKSSCFKETITDTTCEPSAALFDGEKLYLANDKSINHPGHSFVWYYEDFNQNGITTSNQKFDRQTNFLNTFKIEGMSTTPDRKLKMAISAFDRVKKRKNKWDNYNNLIWWNKSDNIKLAYEFDNNGIKSSLPLRKRFLDLLKGKYGNQVEYLK